MKEKYETAIPEKGRTIPKLSKLGGSLRGTDRRPTQKIVDELKKGWE